MEMNAKSVQNNKRALSENNDDVSQRRPKRVVANRDAEETSVAHPEETIEIDTNITMQATKTLLIHRIWGDYYSRDSQDDSFTETMVEPLEIHRVIVGNSEGVRWVGESYRDAIVGGEAVSVGNAVVLEVDGSGEIPTIVFIEYMFERSDMCKVLHGRLLKRGSDTVIGHAASERELYLTNECITTKLEEIRGLIAFEIRSWPWGVQYRKATAAADKLDRERAEERKAQGLPTEYYCRSVYCTKRGGFFKLPISEIGRGSGSCAACSIRNHEKERRETKLNHSKTSFSFNEIEYSVKDYVYVSPKYIHVDGHDYWDLNLRPGQRFKCGRNIGLRAFVVCELLEINIVAPKKYSRNKYLDSLQIKLRIFFRPEDVSTTMAYTSAVQELPIDIKMSFSTKTACDVSANKKLEDLPKEMRLATLDIFAGCGGLSHGLEQAGVSETKWAIEFEKQAGKAFRRNHPKTTVFVDNCNVILRAIMEKNGDGEECISTSEASEGVAKLGKDKMNTLPLPGQVDFICGGPPCQGFSRMNRFNQGSSSKLNCDMILAFLSFVDYFRPKYFLLENVRDFVSFNKGKTFQLTLASLLEMGYQVRFGVLEAGAYGVSQSRRRAFIWACSPEKLLPEWPEPMHVFTNLGLKIPLSRGLKYEAVPSTAKGAPFRSITVRDTIFDLPQVENGESKTKMEYDVEPTSWFQKHIRGNMSRVLNDHICKYMIEINYLRCKAIPKRPGADWHTLPDRKTKLLNGKVVEMRPKGLKNKEKKYSEWKGSYGRLDWQGNFPTTTTDPQPTGMVGICFHPQQDRILSVRECARSQGFPDMYKFYGEKRDKHRQVGNAVPPPLAFALGLKLKQAIYSNGTEAMAHKQWEAPPQGWLKCNSDATRVQEAGTCAVSWILRDARSTVLWFGAKVLPSLISSLEAEAAAMSWAMEYLDNLGMGQVLFETDCQDLWKATQDPSSVATTAQCSYRHSSTQEVSTTGVSLCITRSK